MMVTKEQINEKQQEVVANGDSETKDRGAALKNYVEGTSTTTSEVKASVEGVKKGVKKNVKQENIDKYKEKDKNDALKDAKLYGGWGEGKLTKEEVMDRVGSLPIPYGEKFVDYIKEGKEGVKKMQKELNGWIGELDEEKLKDLKDFVGKQKIWLGDNRVSEDGRLGRQTLAALEWFANNRGFWNKMKDFTNFLSDKLKNKKVKDGGDEEDKVEENKVEENKGTGTELETRIVENAETDSYAGIEKMTEKIINTMKNVDWGYQRGTPTFERDEDQEKEGKITGKFTSWGYSEKITVNMDGDGELKSITIDGINKEFSDPDEGFRTVNLINWIHNNAEKNPRGTDGPGGVGHLDYYHWSNGGDLERAVYLDMGLWNQDIPDIDILEDDYLKRKYPKIHEDEDFLDYINDFL